MTQCQPPNCPCFCPTAGLPIAPVIVAQGGPGVVIVVPIYGTQGFSVSIVTNPLLPIGQNPLIASVQMFNGNELTITTAVPNVAETLGTYVALLKVCNACGELTIQITVEVAADITPIVTDCLLAQALWTFEGRVPAVGDTLLAFTPAGCRALLPPDVCATIQAFPAVVPTLATELATADCGLATVGDVLGLYDLCAALQAFPVALPGPLDTVFGQQAGVCSQFTIFDIAANVDICTLLQNLPNAVVQPTAAFYGQQGGACFEFLVSDLLALAVPPCPLLATCDGSCAAPSYSFASSPDSGMFYDPAGVGSVVIGDDNCNDFIRIGASILLATSGVTRLTLSSAGAITGTAAAGQNIALQTAGGVISLSNSTGPGSIFIGSAGNVQMSAGAGQIANVLAPNAQIQAFAGGQIRLANTLPASPASLEVTTTGKIRLATGTIPTHRFEFTEFGEIRVGVPPGDTPGVAGQVFTSAGPGAAALWQTPATAFPLLAPDGTCLAPSYSFAASPSSGMWFDPALGPSGAVVISDNNCANRINVGASVEVLAAAESNITLQAGDSTTGAVASGFVYIAAGDSPFLATSNSPGTVWAQGGLSGQGNTDGGSFIGRGGDLTDTASSGAGAGWGVIAGGNNTAGAPPSLGAFVIAGGSFDSGGLGSIYLGWGYSPSNFGRGAITGAIRLEINNTTGAFLIDGSAGTLGQALTSNGPAAAPTWQTPTLLSGFGPILGGDGSCLAPTYSFTSSPDSGMFYDPAGVGSVIIGDDNCADFISVGASITLQTAASDITAQSGGNIFLNASTVASGTINLVSGFGPTTIQVADGIAINLIGGAAPTGTAINLNAGAGTAGVGGSINAIAGDGNGLGGALFLQAGADFVSGATGARADCGGGSGTTAGSWTLYGGDSPGGITGGRASVSGGQDVPNLTGGAFLLGGTNGTLTGGSVGTGAWLGAAFTGAVLRGGGDSAGAGGFAQVRGGTGGAGAGGPAFIDGGDGSVSAGDVSIRAGLPSSFVHVTFLGSGSGWRIGGTEGVAGERLTSQGPGLPPIWAP